MPMLLASVHRVFISFAKAMLLVSAAAVLTGIQTAHAARIYVNANAAASGADGLSWGRALPTLQQALDKALITPEADDIWIAQGTYVPTKIYAPNNLPGGGSTQNVSLLATFDLPHNVNLYGGFAGNESSLDQRSPDKYRTVLTGSGVLWHVVTAGNDVAKTGVTAALDGLTIRDGNAQGPSPAPFATLFGPFAYEHDYGGGLYVAFGSNITVNNVQFLNNVANQDGGGMFANNSNVTITNSRFVSNSAGTRGGALEVLNTFEGSTAHTSKIKNTVFDSNVSGLFGGAIVGEGGIPNPASSMDIDQSVFVNNKSIEGGAIVFDTLTTTVRNSSFQRNVASVNAGAISTTNVVNTIIWQTFFHAPPPVFFATTVSNCDFSENVAEGDQGVHDTGMFGGPAASGINFPLGGGALVTYMNGRLNVSGSSFNKNLARNGDGGAILNGRSGASGGGFNVIAYDVETKVTDSRFVGNRAPTGSGGAIASMQDNYFMSGDKSNYRLTVADSDIHANDAGIYGGGIYLKVSTATLTNNNLGGNHAPTGRAVFALDSRVNGSTVSPYIADK